MADGTKFEIDLQGRYVAQNLQKCVLILMQFSEYESNQNWALKCQKQFPELREYIHSGDSGGDLPEFRKIFQVSNSGDSGQR